MLRQEYVEPVFGEKGKIRNEEKGLMSRSASNCAIYPNGDIALGKHLHYQVGMVCCTMMAPSYVLFVRMRGKSHTKKPQATGQDSSLVANNLVRGGGGGVRRHRHAVMPASLATVSSTDLYESLFSSLILGQT